MPSLPHSLGGDKPPVLLKIRSSSAFIIFTVSVATFTDIFCYAVLVPVLPYALESRSGVHPDKVQIITSVSVAIYGASLFLASPVFGILADRTETRRAPLLISLLALLAATIMLCLARSVAVIIVGRALQGISGGAVWAIGMALLVDTVGMKGIGQAMGWTGLSLSISFLIAPLLGGIVFNRAGYTAVYGMMFALVGLDIVLRLILIEKKVARRWLPSPPSTPSSQEIADAEKMRKKDDDRVEEGEKHETSTNNAAIGEIAPAAILPPHAPPSMAVAPADAAAQSATKPAYVSRATKRYESRLPPMVTLLLSRRLLSALWALTAMSSIISAFDSTLAIHVRTAFHWESNGAGLIYLPLAIPSFTGPAVGWLIDSWKHGPRVLSTIGFLLAVPFLVLLRIIEVDTLEQKVVLCVFLTFIGFAMDLVMVPMMAEVGHVVTIKEAQYASPRGAMAQGYGLLNMAWAAGMTIGPIISGAIVDAAGWGTMCWVLGLLAGITAVPVAIYTGGSWRKVFGPLRREALSVRADEVDEDEAAAEVA